MTADRSEQPKRRPRTTNHGSRATPDGPEKIGDVLGRLFTLRGWGRRQGRLHLEQAWSETAGEDIARQTRVAGMKRGVLEIEVGSAVLLQELAHYHKRRLLEGLRTRLAGTTLTDLRFRAGVIPN